jgi:hypothetical protein
MINEIEAGTPEEEFYDAKVKVLSEEIEHHVEEKEKRSEGMFAKARNTHVDLNALGEELAARKEQLKAEMKTDPDRPADPTTLTTVG